MGVQSRTVILLMRQAHLNWTGKIKLNIADDFNKARLFTKVSTFET